MYSVHLPRISEYSKEAALGHGVHCWLEDIHTSENPACTLEQMPSSIEPWSAGQWTIGGEAAVGSAMLRNHVDVCPFTADAPITEVRAEPGCPDSRNRADRHPGQPKAAPDP